MLVQLATSPFLVPPEAAAFFMPLHNGLHCLSGMQVASDRAGQRLSCVLAWLRDSAETGDWEGVAT